MDCATSTGQPWVAPSLLRRQLSPAAFVATVLLLASLHLLVQLYLVEVHVWLHAKHTAVGEKGARLRTDHIHSYLRSEIDIQNCTRTCMFYNKITDV